MDENYIRRERWRKEETKRTVEEMRAALKNCTMDDVRRHKLPFDKALLIGLEEKGHFTTAMFIEKLIDFQTEMREKAGPSSVLWTKPQLKDNKNLLSTLSDNLIKVENYRKMDDYAKECESFLKISTHIAFLHPDWWWLGEQLLLHSINLSKEYPLLQGKYEALSRYVYAKFLLENIRETDAAHGNLSIVRELSKGKKWTIAAFFPDEKDYLYTRTNYLLHICLMQEARTYMKTDIAKAIKLAHLARKRAAEACDLDGETRALLLKGICEVSIRHTAAAIASFTKAFYIQQRLGNLEGICMTQLHLAQAYLMNGDTLESLKTLMGARDCAERNSLPYFLAQAYRHLGEFYLNNGEPRKATPLLAEALKILYKTENVQDIEQVRNLEAISTGLELFPRYLKLLSDTSHPTTGFESLKKMVDWKDSRKQFWSQDDESRDPSAQVSNERDFCSDSVSLASSCDGENTLRNDVIVELHDNIDAFQKDSNNEDELLAFTEEKLLSVKELVGIDEEKKLKKITNGEPSRTG